jgi:hypothetical protein
MQIQQDVICDLPEFPDVTVTYSLMATAKQLDAFRAGLDPEMAKPVVVKVVGLTYEPFGEDAPLAFRFWAGYRGWQTALQQFITDPN